VDSSPEDDAYTLVDLLPEDEQLALVLAYGGSRQHDLRDAAVDVLLSHGLDRWGGLRMRLTLPADW